VDDTKPSWSPDGRQIAFMSTRPDNNGGWHIWIIDAAGTNLHEVDTDFATDPAWSPDGTRIAFASSGSIYVVGVDGSGLQRVTTPPSGSQDGSPDWSPDGSTIAFTRGPTFSASRDLYLASADGSWTRPLTSTGSALAPSWSPDGTKLVFSGGGLLFEVNADGSGLAQVGGSAGQPAWGTSTVRPVLPTDPIVHILSPTPNLLIAPGQQVPAYYLCESAVSVVVSCVGSIPLFGLLDTATAGDKQLTVTATDLEGRQTTKAVTYSVPDLYPPTIDLRAPADGATYDMGAQVVVDFSCADDPAGLGIDSCNGSLPDGASLDTSRQGAYTFNVLAVDRAGHYATETVTYKVLDRTPPTIDVSTPSDGDVYGLGSSVSSVYRCADQPGGSGVASCSATPIDTSTLGSKTFRVTASDWAGNTATMSRTYTVVYAFDGFYSPTAPYPTVNSANPGQSVKVTFSLHGDQGLGVLAAGSPTRVPCGGGGASPADGALTYQATLGRYAFQATTSKSWVGTCRDLVLTLRDGTVHRARFQFNK
jgi:dipeptidyl aminopeptidase/acylaminoacyl peptidase